MKSVEAEGHINAPPEVLWAILTDPAALVGGDLGITQLDGQIALGGQIKLRTRVAPKQVFRLRVTEFQPATQMVWQGGMPLGLFTGRRTFTLTAVNSGTLLHMREVFSGPLSGLIWRTMPDLTPSFTAFIEGVTHLCERSPS